MIVNSMLNSFTTYFIRLSSSSTLTVSILFQSIPSRVSQPVVVVSFKTSYQNQLTKYPMYKNFCMSIVISFMLVGHLVNIFLVMRFICKVFFSVAAIWSLNSVSSLLDQNTCCFSLGDLRDAAVLLTCNKLSPSPFIHFIPKLLYKRRII